MATEPGLQRVSNDGVWRATKHLFLGASVLFLVNVAFGVSNALTTGPIPRWQVLIHLHSGAIGWITLSLVGLAVWLFTGRRAVSAGYERGVRVLVWAAILVFAAYVLGFGLAFSQAGGFLVLLPVLGTGAMLVVWAATAYAVTQLRHLPTVTNVHVLVTGGLLVAAVGATMGVALGFEYVVGTFLPIESPDRTGVHAAMMDAYLLLVASAIVEWFVVGDDADGWTWPGLAQAAAGTGAAVVVPVAFLTNSVATLLPVFGLLLLAFLVLFLARTGWRAFRTNPLVTDVRTWGFFGAIWLVVYVALFLYLVGGLGGSFENAPSWFPAVFAHAAFVGMMTNLLFGVLSARTAAAPDRYRLGEPAALWVLNLGLVVFVAGKVAADVRHGALVMALGALIGLAVMGRRLLEGD